MEISLSIHLRLIALYSILALSLALSGCSGGSDSSSSGENVEDTSSSEADTSSNSSDVSSDDPDTSAEESDATTEEQDASAEEADVTTEEPVDPIGNPVEESVSIDHDTAYGTVEANLKHHINDLDTTVSFLEKSDSVRNMVDMLFGDDDEDGEGEDKDEDKDDDEIDIDLSGMRDDMVDLVADKLMVESTSTVAADGLSITYEINADYFCDEDPEEEEESEEQKNERMKSEAECADRLKNSPLSIVVTSDGEGRMDLSIQAGSGGVEALKLQIHDNVISVASDLPNLRSFVEVFVDPKDFSLPATMEGSFGCEIREEGLFQYTVRCSVTEAINAVADDDQDPFGLKLNKAAEPLRVNVDGNVKTITAALLADATEVSLPWQLIVDMFWDDEGHSETKCKPNDSGGEDCWEEWVDAPEPPEVDEAFIASIPHVNGSLDYAKSDDTFRISEVTMGGKTVTVNVDEDTIVALDLHPNADYTLTANIHGDDDDNMHLEFSPEVDVEVVMAWKPVSSVLDDPPRFLMDETLGVRFQKSDTPTINILRDDEEDTQVKVSSGELTLWSTEMAKDVVIEEGQCITSIDEDGMTEEEKDALHDLFGKLFGDTCEP